MFDASIVDMSINIIYIDLDCKLFVFILFSKLRRFVALQKCKLHYNSNNLNDWRVIVMRQYTNRNEEMKMENEMRILIYDNNKYRDCRARRRWQDEFD